MASNSNTNFQYAAVLFEVQKHGVTVDMDISIEKARSSFDQTSPGGVKLLKLDVGTATKVCIKSK